MLCFRVCWDGLCSRGTRFLLIYSKENVGFCLSALCMNLKAPSTTAADLLLRGRSSKTQGGEGDPGGPLCSWRIFLLHGASPTANPQRGVRSGRADGALKLLFREVTSPRHLQSNRTIQKYTLGNVCFLLVVCN